MSAFLAWLLYMIQYTTAVCFDFLVVLFLAVMWGLVVIAEWVEGRQ